jgi:polyvinyl alcohol dehydrogenase (cytochrome)
MPAPAFRPLIAAALAAAVTFPAALPSAVAAASSAASPVAPATGSPAAMVSTALVLSGADAPAGSAPSPADSSRILCSEPARPVALGSAQWNGWGRGVDNTRYQPEPAIRATDVPKLALKWAFAYSGVGASAQPTIVDGRVFVASAAGRVYSIDARSGCIYWTFDAAAGVRTTITVAELATPRMPSPAKPTRQKKGKHKMTNAHLEMPSVPGAAFFGDERGAIYAVDAAKGTLLWKTSVDAHPSARIVASPTLYKDRLYVAVGSGEMDAAKEKTYACCTFRGSVAALDIASGRILWKTFMVSEEPRPLPAGGGTQSPGQAPAQAIAPSATQPPAAAGVQQFGPAGVPIVAAPTVDVSRGLLYVATGDSYNPKAQPLADAIVALGLEDGNIRWSKQLAAPNGEASDFQAPPVLRALVNGKLLAGQRSGVVYGLDPDRAGEIVWQTQLSDGKSLGAVGWGAAADHRYVYVPLSGLDADGSDLSGSLAALDIMTGAKRWQTETPAPACAWSEEATVCSHGVAQAVTVIPGVAFSGSLDGHLRAYSTTGGRILWDYDTAKDFVTVNHLQGSGGSLDAGGAAIVNGVVFVNSGGGGRGRPGNVLLAFSVDGK